VEELTNLLDVSEKTAAAACPTNDLWQQRRGEIATYRYVLGVEDQVRYQLDNLQDMVFDDEVLDDTGNELEEG
jgi:hypothetical protein